MSCSGGRGCGQLGRAGVRAAWVGGAAVGIVCVPQTYAQCLCCDLWANVLWKSLLMGACTARPD